ncbi:unnamed protein product [Closterium sp. Yama58-4]|nr:unnamed protein product [Closterium sp. Yama58-4]
MAGRCRTGQGGGKAGGKVNGTAGNSPLSNTEHSPEKSPLVSAQASPQALPKTAVDVLGDVVKISLQERLSAVKDNGLKDNEEGNVSQHQQPGSSGAGSSDRQPAPVTEAAGCSKYVVEDKCWDSDDDDDFDPTAVNLLATQVSFPITLLIPIKWESEVPKLKHTVIAHLDHWKASLTADAQKTMSAGKQIKCKDWLRNKADIAILTDTRIQADHNFWTQFKPSTVLAVEPAGSAGGVAVLSFAPGVDFTSTYTHASGKLAGVVIRWGDLELILIAIYSPAQPENRAPFYRDCLEPFLNTLPKLPNILVMGDPNVVEDPALDKSSGVGSWSREPEADGGVSTRIDRALVTQPLLSKLVKVQHADITNKMMDHWSAVVVALELSEVVDRGPGIWRLRAAQTKKRGVRNRVERVLKDAGGDLSRMLPRLTACLRAYTWEEKKRVGATKRQLEKEVKIFKQRLSQNPNCKRTGAILLKKEELLDAYEKSNHEKLQEWLGVKAELDGETTTGFLSGKVKVRKAKTEMSVVHFKGRTHSGAREVLVAATDFFRDSFGGRGETSSRVSEPRAMSRTLCEACRNALSAPWSEEEVQTAVRELASGKSPGQDGLPKELFEHNWDLLGPVLMKFVGDFTRTVELLREISTAVTILLHKKGSKEELGNYRPITLLSTIYKVLAKVMATRFKKVLHEVISEDQVGFLPGRKLEDAVAVVADAIEVGDSSGKDWILLMVGFQKAFNSISRPFLFRTLRGMGFPENFVSWAEGLHTGAGTLLHING